MVVGEKVVLREKRLEDADDDYAWGRDGELSWLDASFPIMVSFSDYLDSYREELKYESRRHRRFAIDTLDGRHIGNCMYYNINERNREAELGIMIGDRSYWDKGYGSDTVTILVGHIFKTTKLERVYLKTLSSNIRAQTCFEKCGFSPLKGANRGGHRFLVMELYRSHFEGNTER